MKNLKPMWCLDGWGHEMGVFVPSPVYYKDNNI